MSMAVELSGVSKKYRKGFRYRSLREDLAIVGRRVLGRSGGRGEPREFWALRNLSLTVDQGEVLGVIGNNGAGKTTTLKLISRISYPTEGSIRVRGRTASLIELTAGMHPELTGRDNIFVYGAILGMSRREMEERYESILSFAELREFIDMPVKHFSTGMYVRLGFSVAVHTEPDVLLVDEVLSVGDVGFQAKSFDRMLRFREDGTTIMFVSHNMPAVAQICDRVLWLEDGRQMMLGDTKSVLSAYLEAQDRRLVTSRSSSELRGDDIGAADIVIERITTHRADGTAADSFGYREALRLRIHYKAFREVRRPYFMVGISHHAGSLFAASMQLDGQCPEKVSGKGVVELLFRELPLLPGTYQVMGQIRRDVSTNYYNPRQLAAFAVAGSLETYGFGERVGLGNSRNTSPVVVPYEWQLTEEG